MIVEEPLDRKVVYNGNATGFYDEGPFRSWANSQGRLRESDQSVSGRRTTHYWKSIEGSDLCLSYTHEWFLLRKPIASVRICSKKDDPIALALENRILDAAQERRERLVVERSYQP
jgi:hypothetical protein